MSDKVLLFNPSFDPALVDRQTFHLPENTNIAFAWRQPIEAVPERLVDGLVAYGGMLKAMPAAEAAATYGLTVAELEPLVLAGQVNVATYQPPTPRPGPHDEDQSPRPAPPPQAVVVLDLATRKAIRSAAAEKAKKAAEQQAAAAKAAPEKADAAAPSSSGSTPAPMSGSSPESAAEAKAAAAPTSRRRGAQS